MINYINILHFIDVFGVISLMGKNPARPFPYLEKKNSQSVSLSESVSVTLHSESKWHIDCPAVQGAIVAMLRFLCVIILCCFVLFAHIHGLRRHHSGLGGSLSTSSTTRINAVTSSVFTSTIDETTMSLKWKILQLSASLDRGQSYNPTSSDAYREQVERCGSIISGLCAKKQSDEFDLAQMEGEWELVFTTVPHGIFRSSPFFLAIQDAYRNAGEADKANLFFKLHELQTCSWGVSKIGRVAQVININGDEKTLISEFDTNLFTLTTIPILGWGKLLPTFGGCVITVSKILGLNGNTGELSLEVDYTTAKKVPGLNALPGEIGVGVKVPVNSVWKLLPWNKGKAPTASIFVRYVDEDIRVMQDGDGEYFVYSRPVFSRL